LQGAVANGTYVYGDFCSGEIFAWTGGPSQPVLLDTALNISSFGEDESGELYVVALGGAISKFVLGAPAPPPAPASPVETRRFVTFVNPAPHGGGIVFARLADLPGRLLCAATAKPHAATL
jgi:hypothetical protein